MVKNYEVVDENKLFFNWNKTKFMVLGNRKKDAQIKMVIDQIVRISEAMDDKLTWKPHIQYIKRKVSNSVAVLYKAKDALASYFVFFGLFSI